MTEELKKQIMELKNKGYGYRKIAVELGLSENSVHSFIQRLNTNEFCKECGAKIKSTPGKRKKLYCDTKCRMAWWSKHKMDINRKSRVESTCACCGCTFMAYEHEHKKYCSHYCYVKTRYGGGSDESR